MEIMMPEEVSVEVLRSWRRCMDLGLSKKINYPQKQIEKEFTDDEEVMLSLFKEVIEGTRTNITDKMIFFLTDNNGILLDYVGCNNIIRVIKKHRIERGTSFVEESLGTNAISLTLMTGQALCLETFQHYTDFFKEWYCCSVPIKVNNKLKGVLDVSTIKKPLKKELMVIAELLSRLIIKDYKLYFDSIKKKKNLQYKLNDKQIKILKLMALGLTERGLARALEESVNTIKYHKKKIYKLLNVQSSCEAVVKSIKKGVISLDEIMIK